MRTALSTLIANQCERPPTSVGLTIALAYVRQHQGWGDSLLKGFEGFGAGPELRVYCYYCSK